MDIELIINTADQASLDQLRLQVERLREDSHLVNARITFEKDDARRFAREAASRGADLVISAGGDGTLNEVVNGLMPREGHPPAGDLPRLGIVPLGTANDFANFIGIPEEIGPAMSLAVDGPELTVDVGMLNGRHFLNVSSGGLGAEATDEASDLAKRLLGSVAYFVTGVRKFAGLRPSTGRFACGEETVFEGDFLFFAVGNGGRTGGGNWITPRAKLADGRLDLCIVQTLTHGDFLRLLPDLRTGDHLASEHVIYRQLPELTVEAFGELSVNLDGEPVPGSVLRYSILPRALRVAGSSSTES